jgi:type II secretory pathway component PulJ
MTLIEVTVAVALLALLSIGLLTSLRFGQRTFEQLNRVDASVADVVAAQRFLRTALESAYPFEAVFGEARTRYGFEGRHDNLELTAPSPQGSGSSGHYRYEIAVATRTDGTKDLVARGAPDRSDRFHAELEETLLEAIQTVEWSYRGSDAQWVSRWTDRRDLPQLVSLRVAFAPEDSRRWPELLIAPRITSDANCAFDVVSQSCRGEVP